MPKLSCGGSRSRSASSVAVFKPCGTTAPPGAVLPQPLLDLMLRGTFAPWCGTTAGRPEVKNYSVLPCFPGTSAVGADVIFYIRNPARYYRRSSCALLSFVQIACVCVFLSFVFDSFCSRACLCVFVSRWWLRFCSSLESQL